jgi:hypothetical protein
MAGIFRSGIFDAICSPIELMGDFNVGWFLGKRILSAEACLTPG